VVLKTWPTVKSFAAGISPYAVMPQAPGYAAVIAVPKMKEGKGMNLQQVSGETDPGVQSEPVNQQRGPCLLHSPA
jgi:hypothetical protein